MRKYDWYIPMNVRRRISIGLMVAAAVGLSSLAGCANVHAIVEAVTTAQVSPQDATIALNGYEGAVVVGTGYLDWCATPAGKATSMCSVSIENSVAHNIRAGHKASIAVRALLRANDGGAIPAANYTTLKTAFDTLESIINNNTLMNHP